MKLTLPPIRISGHFTLDVRKPGGPWETVADFHNLITNIGLDSLGQIPVLPRPDAGGVTEFGLIRSMCSVGTGTTPESASDATIETYLAHFPKTSESYSQVNDTLTRSTTVVFTSAVGGVVGNISEIAVVMSYWTSPPSVPAGWTGAQLPAFSRALIRDASNNPVAISVKADEQLRVTWTLTLHGPSTDIVGSITYTDPTGATSSLGYTARLLNVQTSTLSAYGIQSTYALYAAPPAYPKAIAVEAYKNMALVPTGNPHPAGTELKSVQVNIPAYTPGNHYLTVPFEFLAADANDAAGISGFEVRISSNWPFTWQVKLDSPIPKTSLHKLLGSVTYSWDRY